MSNKRIALRRNKNSSVSVVIVGAVLVLHASNLSGILWYHKMLLIDPLSTTTTSTAPIVQSETSSSSRRLLNDSKSIPPAAKLLRSPTAAYENPTTLRTVAVANNFTTTSSATAGGAIASLDTRSSLRRQTRELPIVPSSPTETPLDEEENAQTPTTQERSSSSSSLQHAIDWNTQLPYQSHFEERWPDFYLPGWAQKWLSIPGLEVPPHKSICYVHVGKTAGSTIGCALGFRLHCHKERWHPQGVLPHLATHLLHSDVNDCPLNAAYYLMTLRDPVERIKSWFNYEQAALYQLREECPFHTLNDLAIHGLQKRAQGTTEQCRERAKRAIKGEQRFGYHNAHNYAYHLSQIPINGTIGVIRSEHMVEDWNAMEALLGSNARVKQFARKNVGRPKPPASDEQPPSQEVEQTNATTVKGDDDVRYLSPQGQRLICFYLCDEIQVYKQILMRAVNLQPADIQQSMNELRRSCPHEADVSGCPYYELKVDF